MKSVIDNHKWFTLLFSISLVILNACSSSNSGDGVIEEEVTYYHFDALGSTIAATDEKGQVIWQESYASYGKRITPEAGEDLRVGYAGQTIDRHTGLSYHGARWYDPRIGRFMSPDPVEVDLNNIQSFNRYAYANNNPYTYIDPDGEFAETAIDLVSLGFSIAAYKQEPSILNAIGLAYDSVATAIPFLPAGVGIIRQAGRVGSGAKNTPQKLYHYTGANPNKIASDGLVPGGSGKVFTTADGSLSPLQAQIDLALPPNRGLPGHLLEIDVPTLQKIGVDIPQSGQVGRMFNMPGGGTETVFPNAIPAEAIRVVR